MMNFARALVLLALLPTAAAAQTQVQSRDLGQVADPAVTGDANGSLIGHIRYLDKALADVWDISNHRINVNCAAGCTSGSLSNNNAAPTSNLNGAMTHIASAAGQSYTEGRLVLPRTDLFGSTAVRILKSDGTDVAYIPSITEAATETAATSLQAVSAYIKAYDGATFARLRSRAGLIGSADIGLVVRPFLPSDGTNTMPAMDSTVRTGFVTSSALKTDGTYAEPDIACTNSKIYDTNTSGNSELVPISGTKTIYVCGYEVMASGTVNVSLVTGTGTACASAASGTPSTGTSGASASLTPAWQLTTQTGKLSAYPTHGWLLSTGSANALCIKTSGAVSVQMQVFYHQR